MALKTDIRSGGHLQGCPVSLEGQPKSSRRPHSQRVCDPKTLTPSALSPASFPLVHSALPANLLTLTQAHQGPSCSGTCHQPSPLLEVLSPQVPAEVTALLPSSASPGKVLPDFFHIKLQSSSLKPLAALARCPPTPFSAYHHVYSTFHY